MSADTAIAVVVLTITGIAVLVAVMAGVRRRTRMRRASERLEHMSQAAQEYLDQLSRGTRPVPVQTAVFLPPDEVAVLVEPQSTLMEPRALRVYGGAGTRIGGIYVGGGVSESHQRLRTIASGELVLTTRRIVFDGDLESRAVKLTDVLSVQPWVDAIEVSTSRRQKNQFYSVQNPILWAEMIRRVAAGELPGPRSAGDAFSAPGRTLTNQPAGRSSAPPPDPDEAAFREWRRRQPTE